MVIRKIKPRYRRTLGTRNFYVHEIKIPEAFQQLHRGKACSVLETKKNTTRWYDYSVIIFAKL